MSYDAQRSTGEVRAMGDRIPLAEPDLSGREWEYVKACLDSGWISSASPFVARFERNVAAICDRRHAVATVNGTAALHLALLAAGVGPGDAVLVSTLTFIAPANAVRYVGARPVFVDAEAATWQMDPRLVERFVAGECDVRAGVVRLRSTGERLKAILPVHVLGHPVDLDPILSAARQFGLFVIEDATESLGAVYRGRQVGALGDLACLSFNGNKVVTTGGGGVVLADRQDWADRMRYFSTQAKTNALEYVHGDVGYNYRLSGLLAAVGCAQLERLDAFLSAKRRIADRYRQELADIRGIDFMPEAAWAKSGYWLSTIVVGDGDSRALLRDLDRQGIETRPLWQPLHLSPAMAPSPRIGGAVAEDLQRRALHLPCSTSLTEKQQSVVIGAIRDYFRR
jgi:perosamine synthetase